MRWFGKAYGAPYERDTPHMATPVGSECDRCSEPFVEGDSGLAVPLLGVPMKHEALFHYACHMRGVLGGVNHQRKLCTCCGGTLDPDPEGMTRREAAEAAVREYFKQ